MYGRPPFPPKISDEEAMRLGAELIAKAIVKVKEGAGKVLSSATKNGKKMIKENPVTAALIGIGMAGYCLFSKLREPRDKDKEGK